MNIRCRAEEHTVHNEGEYCPPRFTPLFRALLRLLDVGKRRLLRHCRVCRWFGRSGLDALGPKPLKRDLDLRVAHKPRPERALVDGLAVFFVADEPQQRVLHLARDAAQLVAREEPRGVERLLPGVDDAAARGEGRDVAEDGDHGVALAVRLEPDRPVDDLAFLLQVALVYSLVLR